MEYEQECFFVQTVQIVQAVQTLSFVLPRVAGEEKRWGLERSVAVEPSEAIERLEQISANLRSTPTLSKYT
jgi:hypothetical protein